MTKLKKHLLYNTYFLKHGTPGVFPNGGADSSVPKGVKCKNRQKCKALNIINIIRIHFLALLTFGKIYLSANIITKVVKLLLIGIV